jgi:hypothetical protein
MLASSLASSCFRFRRGATHRIHDGLRPIDFLKPVVTDDIEFGAERVQSRIEGFQEFGKVRRLLPNSEEHNREFASLLHLLGGVDNGFHCQLFGVHSRLTGLRLPIGADNELGFLAAFLNVVFPSLIDKQVSSRAANRLILVKDIADLLGSADIRKRLDTVIEYIHRNRTPDASNECANLFFHVVMSGDITFIAILGRGRTRLIDCEANG